MRETATATISLLLAAALAVVAPAASAVASTRDQASPGATPQGSPALSFTLSTTGLPADGRWKSTPIVLDLNKDGHLDLAAHVRLGRKAGAWFGDGRGGWTDAGTGLGIPDATTCGGGLAFADVNRDGHLDVAIGDHCEGALIYLGSSDGKWQVVTKALNPAASLKPEYEGTDNPYTGAEDVALGDVNGDGFQDLAFACSDRGGIVIMFGDGTGKAWKEAKVTGLPTADDPGEGDEDEGGWVRRVILHDMNGDGHLDIVAAYHRGPRVWLGDGKGMFKASSQGFPSPMIYGAIQSVTIGDVNEDGRPDVAVAHAINGAEIYAQQPDGSWKLLADPMPDLRGGAQSVGLGDLDGDGHLDLVIGGRRLAGRSATYGLFVFKGDGNGGWTAVATNLPETGLEITWGIATGDLNGDKRTDVVVTLGGAGGMQSQKKESEEKPSTGTLPNIQVWLNKAP